MNNGKVNVVILLDLKKAFDVVDHDIMAKKLGIYVLRYVFQLVLI
jgi:hypothetical protein